MKINESAQELSAPPAINVSPNTPDIATAQSTSQNAVNTMNAVNTVNTAKAANTVNAVNAETADTTAPVVVPSTASRNVQDVPLAPIGDAPSTSIEKRVEEAKVAQNSETVNNAAVDAEVNATAPATTTTPSAAAATETVSANVTASSTTTTTTTTKAAVDLTVSKKSEAPESNPSLLLRRRDDLKRYLYDLDEEFLRKQVVPKLMAQDKRLFESVRTKMQTHSIMCKIFIRSMSYETKDQTVHDMFSRYGEVKEAVIISDPFTKLSKGFGFITMSNASESQKALTNAVKKVDGRDAVCNLAAKPQGDRAGLRWKPFRKGFDFARWRPNSRGPPSGQRSSYGGRRGYGPRNGGHDRFRGGHPPQAPYPYHGANPYGFDYSNYQYPAGGMPPMPFPGMNPFMNPYAHFNRNAAGAGTAGGNANASQGATVGAANNTNTANVAAQPFAGQTGNVQAFNAAAYRFT